MSSNAFNKLDLEYTEREDYLANRAEERSQKPSIDPCPFCGHDDIEVSDEDHDKLLNAAVATSINSPHNACMFRTDCRKAEAEIARLREDAERYRWLRDDKRGRMLSVSSLEWTGDPKLSDAAIDAARKDTK